MNKQNSEYFFFHQYSWPSFWYLKLDSVLISYQVLNGHFCFVQVFSNSLPFLTSIFYQITMEIPLTSKNCSQADISRRFFSREKQIFLVSFFFNIPGISTQIQKPAKYYSKRLSIVIQSKIICLLPSTYVGFASNLIEFYVLVPRIIIEI